MKFENLRYGESNPELHGGPTFEVDENVGC